MQTQKVRQFWYAPEVPSHALVLKGLVAGEPCYQGRCLVDAVDGREKGSLVEDTRKDRHPVLRAAYLTPHSHAAHRPLENVPQIWRKQAHADSRVKL